MPAFFPTYAPCAAPLTPDQQAIGRRRTIWASVIAMFFFGTLSERVMSLLALRLDQTLGNVTLSMFFVVIPGTAVLTALMGPVVDRKGKKRVIIPFYLIASVFLLPILILPLLTQWFTGRQAVWVLVIVLSAYSVSRAMGQAGWFPLINDNVPSELRGRFFAGMRTCWQLTLFGVSVAVGWFLGKEPEIWQFLTLFVIAHVSLLARAWVIATVPEAPIVRRTHRLSFFTRLGRPLRSKSYRRFLLFSALVFFSFGFQGPFGLRLMRDELLAGDGMIVGITAFVSLGAVSTLYLWGRAVDRFGSRLVCALLVPPMALLNLVWVLVSRDSPLSLWWIGLYYFGYGAVFYGITVAGTAMMLSQAGKVHRGAYINVSVMTNNLSIAAAPVVSSLLAGWWQGSSWAESFSANRLIFAVRLVLTLCPLLVLPFLSRRHGGNVRQAAGAFFGSIPALRFILFRSRT